MSRRAFLRAAAGAGAAILWRCPAARAAEPPPETTRLRLVREPSI